MGKKISVWSGVTLFVLTLAVAGCGKKEEPPPPAPPPAAPAPEAPGGAPGGPGAMAPAPGGGEPAPGAPAAPGETKMGEKKEEGMKKK